jgi:hypothetical protein
MPDFSDDILGYLRQRRGKLIGTMDMLYALTSRIKDREYRRKVRGHILSNLAALIQQKKVIRYRRLRMVKKRPRSSQGFLRVSELWA